LDLFGQRNKAEADASMSEADKKNKLTEIDKQLAQLN
jgi:phosphonate transport system substrate-binding protein